MITAIDTAVLISIDQGESDAEAWMDLLIDARSEGALVICDVVAAEFFAVVMDQLAFDATMADLGVNLVHTSRRAACHAGAVFRRYRDQGGPRERLIPDFLIAAHAWEDADRLASPDRGYLRRCFPELTLIRPGSSRQR